MRGIISACSTERIFPGRAALRSRNGMEFAALRACERVWPAERTEPSAKPRVSECWRRWRIRIPLPTGVAYARFLADSLLEEAGLKLLVPLRGLVPIALSKMIGNPARRGYRGSSIT